MSSSGSDDEPVPSPTTEFAQYQSLLQKSVISSAKLAASLPPKADLNFQRALDRRTGKDLDTCSTRILGLTNRLFAFLQESVPAASSSSAKGKGKARMLESDEDVEERYHGLVVDIFDSMYENIDSCLDEFNGKKTLAVPLAPAETTSSKPDITKRLEKNILHASNLRKPQLKFSRQPDNSSDDWKHTLKNKLHSIKPLDHDPHPYRPEIEATLQRDIPISSSAPIPPRSYDETPFTWVDTSTSLDEMTAKLKAATEIAVDLEHHDYRTYRGFVCLMQISTRDEDFIVDTLSLRDELEALNDVFADPSIVKVFHGAESDIKWLQRDFNLYVVNLFDTYHASVELSFPKKSLAYLLARYCDFTADKRYQLADWRIRPLPEEMLAYARSDTHSLLYIYDNLRDELLQLGDGKPDAIRTVLQNSATTALNVYQHEQFSKEGAHVLARKWNKGFYGKPLAIFETLYEWRDQIARLEDENPRYVLPNHFLFPLAERPPKDVPGLLSAIQPTPPLVRSHASELIETIKSAAIVFTKESALKAKAKADFGAMDVDSGPFANVGIPESEGDTQLAGSVSAAISNTSALFSDVSDLGAYSASASSFFGIVDVSRPVTSSKLSKYQDVVSRIQSTLVLTPALPALIVSDGQEISAMKPAQPISAVEPTIPTEPEQIAFVPLAQRQSTASGLIFGHRSMELDLVKDVLDDVVEVKDPSRKTKVKTKRPDAEVIEKSLLAAVVADNEPEPVAVTDPVDDDVIVLPKTEEEIEKAELKKRKRKEAKKRKNQKGADQDKPEGSEAFLPYDYSAGSNLLDEGIPEPESSHQPKKRKMDKGDRKNTRGGLQSGIPAGPRSQVNPKSGNKSMTYRPAS